MEEWVEALGLGDSCSIVGPGLVPPELFSICFGLVPARADLRRRVGYKGRAEVQGADDGSS